jgi:hypothetical protein
MTEFFCISCRCVRQASLLRFCALHQQPVCARCARRHQVRHQTDPQWLALWPEHWQTDLYPKRLDKGEC